VATGYLTDLSDWRTAFALLSFGSVAAFVLTVSLVPRIKSGEMFAHTPSTHVLDLRPVLRCRKAMAFVLGYTIHNFELFAFRAWTVAFLIYAVSLDSQTGLPLSIVALAAIINLLGVPASILGNEFAMKIGRHRWIFSIMVFSAVVATLTGFAANWSLWLVIGFLCLYAATITADSSALTSGVVDAAPPGYLGATMAVHSSIGFTGAFLGPVVFGAVLDLSGEGLITASWTTAFMVVGAISLTGPLLMRWVDKPAVE
jgi:predicted MFS family arabinose efflux permease